MMPENENRPSERIEVLKRRIRESYSERMHSQRKTIFARLLGETRSEPQIIRAAKGLAAFLREKDGFLCEEELLAGHAQSYDYSVPPGEKKPPSWPEFDIGGNPEEIPLLEKLRQGFRVGLFGSYIGGHVIGGYECVLARSSPLSWAKMARISAAMALANERYRSAACCAPHIWCRSANWPAAR